MIDLEHSQNIYRSVSTRLGNSSEFQFKKNHTISKNSTDTAGAVTIMPVFISDLIKSNHDKYLYLNGSVLQSLAAL